MATRRDIRRLAMQVLYQIDQTDPTQTLDPKELMEAVDEDFNPDPGARAQAVNLAMASWQSREKADELFTELAPDWPTPRQPPVDRAILRLAYHEMTSGRSPVKIAINEAIELAKEYGTKESSLFINGVLDKAAKHLDELSLIPPETEIAKPDDPDVWLADAVEEPNA